MARGSWWWCGVAAVLVGCANGSADDGAAGDDDASSGQESDGAAAGDANGTHLGDAASASDVGSDTTIPTGDDDSGSVGDDGSAGDDAAGDDSATGDDASDGGTTQDAGADTGAPDTGVDSGHDAGVDSGTDSGIKDAGADTNAPDTGTDAGCQPVTGSTYTKKVHQPGTWPVGTCSASQVQAFYNACLNGTPTACDTWRNANANLTCDTCLEGDSDPAGSDWGPFLDYTADQIVEIDLGGCILAVGGHTTCGDDLEYLTECEHAACDLSCQGQSLGNVQACITAADNGPCANENNAVNTACGSITSSCFAGSDFESAFLSVAADFCE